MLMDAKYPATYQVRRSGDYDMVLSAALVHFGDQLIRIKKDTRAEEFFERVNRFVNKRLRTIGDFVQHQVSPRWSTDRAVEVRRGGAILVGWTSRA
jgi:hypothetical protein